MDSKLGSRPSKSEISEDAERLQLLVNSIEDYAIYMLDCAGQVMTWNRGAELNKGYRKEEILGRNFRMFFVPEDIAAGAPERELAEALKSGRAAGESWRLRKNGERVWVTFVLTAMIDRQGKHIGFAKVMRDLTERKRQQDAMFAMDIALREERDRLHAVAESSMDALFICDALRNADGQVEDFVFTYLNSKVETLTGMLRADLLGRRMRAVGLWDGTAERMERFRNVMATGEPFACEFFSGPGTEGSWLRLQVVRLSNGIAITASDITLRKQYETRMTNLAERDALTGLLNRNVLHGRLERAQLQANRKDGRAGVFLLDLDAFKAVNDTFGHSVGDAVLQAVARRLEGCVRTQDEVIRIGGDEFVIILPEMGELQSARALADRILESLSSTPIAIAGQEIWMSCSLGGAVCQGDAESTEHILSRADAAMYAAKALGRNCMVWDESGSTREFLVDKGV